MKLDFYYSLNKIKSYLKQVTDVLLVIVAVALLLGVLFGPDAPITRNLKSFFCLVLEDPLTLIYPVSSHSLLMPYEYE